MFKKMMMLFLMGFSISVFSNEKLMGGDRVGNGGDVVICGNKIELLDIYEARTSGYGMKSPAGTNYQEMLKSLLQNNLHVINPKRTEKYLKFLETFEKESQFLAGIQLSDVDDAGMVAIPQGCSLQQIAIQLSDDERPAGKKRYTVSLDLWNKLDEYNKMSLVLHEIIYREAIEHKSSNSMVVRATVGEVLKTKIDLDIYLSLVADFSNTIEYKKFSWSVCELCKPIVSLDVNEYDEPIIRLEENSLTLQLDKGYNTPEVEIRLQDGKILDAGDSFRFLRAGKETWVRGDYGYPVKVVTDQDLDYQAGTFLNPKNARIQIQNGSDIIDFKNVNKLKWYRGFRGQFNLQYKDITLNDPEESFIEIDGIVRQYGQKKNAMMIKFEGNKFNCHSYEYEQNGYPSHLMKNCEAGTFFEINIKDTVVMLGLVENTDLLSFHFSNIQGEPDVVGFLQGILISTEKSVLLGTNPKTGLAVYIQPGEYRLSKNISIGDETYSYLFVDKNFSYKVTGYGEVFVDPL